MSYDSNNGMRPADIAAVVNPGLYGGGGWGGNGFGSFGGDWLILLFLFMIFGGGWGMMGGMGGMGGFGGMMLPWWLMNQNTDNNVNGRFDQLATANGISALSGSVANGFSDVQLGIAGVTQTICQTGNGITGAVRDGFASAEIAANNRQMANMQQAFAAQTAMGQGFNALGAQLAQCCCDNRLATEQLRGTILQENCADRYEAANNTRDIIEASSRNTQALLDSNQKLMDKLCQLELDGIKQNYENRIAGMQNTIDQVRSDNQALRFGASQTAQTGQILAGQAARAAEVERYVNPTPVPSYTVPNPYTGCCAPQGNYCNGGCGYAA